MPPEPETLPPKAEGASPAGAVEAPPHTGEKREAAAEAPTRRHRARVDLTTGSVPKKLFAQAWPQVTESVLNIADQFVDLFWAGRLPGGFHSIASVGVAQTFTQFAGMGRMGFDVAKRAMIARAVGSRDIPLANHILFQGLFITGAYSSMMVLIGLFLTGVFLDAINASPELRADAQLYMQIQFIGNATMGFRMATGTALQAAGDPIIPLRATTVSRLLHILLAPFLMFGWWGLPEMGLAGTALATVIAQVAGIAMNVYALLKDHSRIRLSLNDRPDFPLMWRMIKLAAPASVRGMERASSQLALLGIAAPFGDVALAAYAITRRVDMFTNFGSGGLAQATGVMVGQNLGANHIGRVKSAILWGLLYVALMKGTIISLFWAFPHAPISIFLSDPAVLDFTVMWLRIQLFGAFFQGQMQVMQESYMAAGDTIVPLIVTLIGVWVFEVPLAWYLARHTDLGALGVAVAAIPGFGVRALIFGAYYFHGRWLRIKVI